MPCTTILVGKNATYDGSTMIARNDDAGGNDHFTPKKMIVVQPKEQPRVYKAVLSSVEIPLPEIHFAIRLCQMRWKERESGARVESMRRGPE